MAYYVAVPTDNRAESAWKHIEDYLETERTQQLQAMFIQCRTYRDWSFSLALIGIEGWSVAASWDDMGQTCRDSQS